MAALPSSFVFAQVPSTAAESAFEFHRNFASKDPHIHPRIESEIAEFAQSGHLFGVRRKDTNEFVGLCYLELARIGSQLFVFDSATSDQTVVSPLFDTFDTHLSAQPLSEDLISALCPKP